MKKPIQLELALDPPEERIMLPPDALQEVLDGMACLLLQVQSVDVEEEVEDDLES